MSKDFFRFKQFDVYHNRTAMKVGTDGVLIGAWCDCNGRSKVLDVGSGTGVVALMVAQRDESAIIDAVEIDSDAALQAFENFERSLWKERLSVKNCSFQEYAQQNPTLKYDLIVSNPPYFVNSLKNEDIKKQLARHTDSLSYNELIDGVDLMLSDDGVFSAIFPYEEANIFVAMAAKKGFFCVRRVDIKGAPERAVKRVMLELSRVKREPMFDELVIENSGRGGYSKRYIELTRDFYLKF